MKTSNIIKSILFLMMVFFIIPSFAYEKIKKGSKVIGILMVKEMSVDIKMTLS